MVYFRLQGTNLAFQTVVANCFGANTYAFIAFARSQSVEKVEFCVNK